MPASKDTLNSAKNIQCINKPKWNLLNNTLNTSPISIIRVATVAQELNGYDERNFLLTDAAGKKYIFKIATDEHGYDFLDAQVKIINHLAVNCVSKKFQHFFKYK